MSNLTVASLSAPLAAGNKINVPSPNILYAPGHIIQVAQNHLWDQTTVSVPSSYTTFTDIPDLTCSITPKSNTSKIYVVVRWMGEFGVVSATWNLMWNLKRNGALIGRNPSWPTDRSTGIQISATSYTSTDANSTPESVIYNFLDSPESISTLTYQACVVTDTANTLYTNRCVSLAAGGYEFGTSSITLMEIAQ